MILLKKAFVWRTSAEQIIFLTFVLILFFRLFLSSTNTPPNWTIHSSDIQMWVYFSLSDLNVLFAFGKSNISHIWMLPCAHLLWLLLCVCLCLSPVCITVWFGFCVFLCLPYSSFLPSSSPPIPQPCQACPRCSHTQDPSARCKEPSSPRSDPHPCPQPAIYNNKKRYQAQACT